MFWQKLRVKTAQKLWQVSLGPIAGGMPTNCVFSIEERSGIANVSRHIHDIHPIEPSEICTWQHPDFFPSWIRRTFAFSSRNVFTLDDVVVAPISGAVWSPSGLIFMESIGSLNKALTFGKVLPEMLKEPREFNIAGSDVLIPCSCASYFHWVFEVLPSILHTIRLFPGFRLLLSPARPKYIDESLRLLLGDDKFFKCIIESSSPIFASRAAFLTMPPASGFVRPSDFYLLRNTFLNLVKSKISEYPSKNIFISRRGSKARSVSRQDKIEAEYAAKDFEIWCVEKLPWRDQILLLSAANHVVGFHGAGFSNAVFAPHSCKITEIFPSGYTNDCYARLASSLKFGYTFQIEK